MNFDMTEWMESWPYDPANATNNFRRAEAADGRPLVQVREPLGIQQMEYLGRPDGDRPMGKTTWLEYYQERAELEPGYILTHDDSVVLMQEGVLFYQRYLILYQMEDWEGVARDTERNLGYFDFTKEHAQKIEDSLTIEQYRPYVLRMNSIARSHVLWNRGRHNEATELLRETIETIKGLDEVPSQVFRLEREKSEKHLTEVIEEFECKMPESMIERLKREKTQAIRREDFEVAARLRDEIRSLEGHDVARN